MPQNPQDIVNSQEFKDFCKNNNLEVFNVESINLSLYNLSKENKELKERLMEAGRYISYEVLDNGKPIGIEYLADKWK